MALDPNIILAASANTPQFQSPIDTFQKAMGLRELMNRSQMSDLAAKQQQQAYGDQQSLRTLLQGNANPTAEQVYGAAGPQAGSAYLNSVNEYKTKQAIRAKAEGDAAEQAADFLGRGASLVQKANYDPSVAIQTLQSAKGTPFEQKATGLIQQIQQDPTQVKSIFDGLATQAESLKDQQAAQNAAAQAAAQQQKANAATANANTNATKADRDSKVKDLATVGALFGNAQNQNDWAMAFAKAQAAGVSKDVLNTIPTAFNPSAAQSIAKQAMSPDQAATLGLGAQRNVIAQQDANVAAQRANIDRQRLSNENAAVTLTPEAKQALADGFASGAPVLSGLGMGRSGAAIKSAIINQAAATHPGLNIGLNQADYGSNKQSLQSLQKSKDAIESFESTALKNLNLVKDAAAKIPDWGAAWANEPVRTLALKNGNTNVTDFNTKLKTAQAEIGKVLSGGGLSGTLTDSARTEMNDALSQYATRGQIEKAITALQADMNNRKQGLNDQINTIQGRMGAKQPAAAAQVTHRFNPATGQIEAVQ